MSESEANNSCNRSNQDLIINENFDFWKRGKRFTSFQNYSADRWGNHNYQVAAISRVASFVTGS